MLIGDDVDRVARADVLQRAHGAQPHPSLRKADDFGVQRRCVGAATSNGAHHAQARTMNSAHDVGPDDFEHGAARFYRALIDQ